MSTPRYSIILPIFNEEATLPELFQRIPELLSRLDGPTEVLLIDDGSRDRSFEILSAHASKDQRFKVIRLSRNFGHQVAISAGIDHASGEATIIMDADLQDPPEVVLQLIEKWKQGYEVVYAVRDKRLGEGFFKRVTARLFYRILGKLTDLDIPVDVGDFRLVDRHALLAFREMRENSRYVRGMFSWIGFKQIGVPYTRQERFAGETHYPFRKMLKLAKDGIFSFSHVPLKMALNLGLLLSLGSFLAGVWALTLKLTGAYTVQGWTSLAVIVSFVGGAQLVVIGILGEYVGRIYEEVKRRPLYVIREKRGL